MLVLSLFAEVVSNDRPLIVRYNGSFYFPLTTTYSEKTFGGDFETATDYLDPFIREQLSKGGNWAVYAPNPYGPKTINYFAKEPNPSRPTRDNLLGTDDRGRDLLAQLIYGFRLSVLFALALTAIGVLIGVVTGAIQGFFAGKTDLAFQRFIEIWDSMPELYLLIIFSAIFAPSVALLLVLLSLFGWMGLSRVCACRIPAQPADGVCEGGARARRGQRAHHVAPHPAQQHDAGDHLPAVSHERRHPGAHVPRLPGLGGAARHAIAG